MTVDHFRLPAAWWSPGGCDSATVGYGDLAEPLGALAAACGVDLPAVLAAAHLKVLRMLTEEPVIRTDIRWAPHDRAAHTVRVATDTARTWRELVDLVRQARPEPDRRAAGEDSSSAGRALFTTDDSVSGTPLAGPHGLLVGVRGDTVLLRAVALDPGCLSRLASLYRCVLEAMCDGPDGDAVAARLPSDERHAVLSAWGAGPSVGRGTGTVVDLFRRQAARTPLATAVTVAGLSVSYRELDRRSDQLARHLAGLGVHAETLVGVAVRRTADLLPAILGVWKAGAAYLPLDPDLPAQRLHRMISAAGCDLLITHTEHLPVLGTGPSRTVVLLDTQQAMLAAQGSAPPTVPVGPAQLAYVMYTSGSTGAPKGVQIHHGALANYLLWTAEQYAARGTGGSAFFTSISFDLGIPSLLTPLLVGQPVHLLPEPLDPADLGTLLVAGAPYSFLKMTPGHLNLLSLDLSPEQAHDLAGLVIAAGDSFPMELARRWAELAGPGGTPVATEYGPTEVTIGNSGQLVTDHGGDGLIPLGTPIPNTTMYVLNGELEPVPVGVPGEVYVGGAGVGRGYLADPALTASRFRPDPFGPPGARLYRTGDRARWRSSGELEFLGRTDNQVKIRGFRVELGEITETLRRHPDVDDAVVIASEQPARSPRLAAFVLPAPGRTPDTARLRAELAAELPEHMVPAEILTVGRIPLTANGKVDTHALAQSTEGTRHP